jgi:hypothetical protein
MPSLNEMIHPYSHKVLQEKGIPRDRLYAVQDDIEERMSKDKRFPGKGTRAVSDIFLGPASPAAWRSDYLMRQHVREAVKAELARINKQKEDAKKAEIIAEYELSKSAFLKGYLAKEIML